MSNSPEVENGIVSRIVVGCGLDPDSIPYDEGTDPVDHLIQLFKHHREQAEADVTQLREELDAVILNYNELCDEKAGLAQHLAGLQDVVRGIITVVETEEPQTELTAC